MRHSRGQRTGESRSSVRATAGERERMIAETSAFLTWALRRSGNGPRIPRRRVSSGGFSELLKRPGARAAVEHWWHRVLDEFGA